MAHLGSSASPWAHPPVALTEQVHATTVLRGLLWTRVGSLPREVAVKPVPTKGAIPAHTWEVTTKHSRGCRATVVSASPRLAICLPLQALGGSETTIGSIFHEDSVVVPPKPFHNMMAVLPILILGRHKLDLLPSLPMAQLRRLSQVQVGFMVDALPELILQAAAEQDTGRRVGRSSTLAELVEELRGHHDGEEEEEEGGDKEEVGPSNNQHHRSDDDDDDEGDLGGEQDGEDGAESDGDDSDNTDDQDLVDPAAVRKAAREREIIDGLLDEDDDDTDAEEGVAGDEEEVGHPPPMSDTDSDDSPGAATAPPPRKRRRRRGPRQAALRST